MALTCLLTRLSDPQLVVWFQKLCGVEYLPNDLHADDPAAEGTHHHNNHDVTETAAATASATRGGLSVNSFVGLNDCADVRWRGKQDQKPCAPCQDDSTPNNDRIQNNNKNKTFNNNEENTHNRITTDSKAVLNGGPKLASGNGTANASGSYSRCASNHNSDTPQVSACSKSPNGYAHTATSRRPSPIGRCKEEPTHPAIGSHRYAYGSDCAKSCANGGSASATRPTNCPNVLIRYPALYYLAQIGAFLGNEEFYLTGLPFMLWSVDGAMVRQVTMMWWMVMYLGQATKDYLGWPRPPSPPIVRLEFSHLAEFSMPSTHAMAGTAIPLVLATLLLERYDLPTLPVSFLAFLWCTTTSLSRLYLGVHTVLDLMAGVAIALGVYILAYPLMGRVDLYQQTNTLAPIALVATSLALCTICYPSHNKSSARTDAITITAVIVGVGIGSWLNYQLGYSVTMPAPVRAPVSLPSWWWLLTSLLQFFVGLGVVLAMKVAMKAATVRFFSFWFGLEHPDSKHPFVLIGYKYTTYCSLGLAIAFLDPLIFAALGFGRPAFYMEVV